MHASHIHVQWSLRIKDTLGAGHLSFIGRLSSGGRFKSLLKAREYVNRCHSQCPLYGGCPQVGGSFIGGSTVYTELYNEGLTADGS